mmetsp:Transcript_10841/g.19600  ORF Transcript_10841/g.19600 Transcript_10841/m.19600 type:complete len:656 (-) Transcript_10841:1068-3035(-)
MSKVRELSKRFDANETESYVSAVGEANPALEKEQPESSFAEDVGHTSESYAKAVMAELKTTKSGLEKRTEIENVTDNELVSVDDKSSESESKAYPEKLRTSKPDSNNSLSKMHHFITSGTGSSRGLDVAIGLTLGLGILGILYANLLLFAPTLMGVLIASLLSITLLPLRNASLNTLFSEKLDQHDNESSDIFAEEQFTKDSMQMVFAFPRKTTIGIFVASFTILLVLNPVRAGALILLALSFIAIGVGLWAFLKALVFFKAIERETAAATFALGWLLSCLSLAALGLFAGASLDAANATMAGGTWAREHLSQSIGKETLEGYVEMVQNEALKLAEKNKNTILQYSHIITEHTGIDLTKHIESFLKERASNSDGAGTSVKDIVSEFSSAIRAKVPSSSEEAMELVNKIRSSVNVEDLSPYQDAAVSFAGKFIGFVSGLAESAGNIFESFSNVLSMLGMMFVFLTQGVSSISFLTRIIPFPSSRLNSQVDHDLEFALTAVFWGLLRFFSVNALYVWMMFSAFYLEFEFVTALLAGISSAIPLMPAPWVFTLLFSAPQLWMRKQWALLILIPLGHMVLAMEGEYYYRQVSRRMVIGSAVLNRTLLTVSSVLGAAQFGTQGLFLAPLLVVFSSVLYSLLRQIILSDQNTRAKCLEGAQ